MAVVSGVVHVVVPGLVWEAQPDIQTRTVDMHVQRLRTKLADAGKLIETVRGVGYVIREE